MPNDKTFLVDIERITPVCGADCPFLDIYTDRFEFYADVCKHMDRSMKEIHDE